MNDKASVFHLDVLSHHNLTLYEDLLHAFQVQSSLKEMSMEDMSGLDKLYRGFFVKKEVKEIERKFFIREADRGEMPFKIVSSNEKRLKTSGGYDIVIHPDIIKPFKIKPEKKLEVKEMIDLIAPFNNTNPLQYKIIKIISIVSYVTKTFIAISSQSEFGKSSIFELIHSITDKSPVFKPRSIPGVSLGS